MSPPQTLCTRMRPPEKGIWVGGQTLWIVLGRDSSTLAPCTFGAGSFCCGGLSCALQNAYQHPWPHPLDAVAHPTPPPSPAIAKCPLSGRTARPSPTSRSLWCPQPTRGGSSQPLHCLSTGSAAFYTHVLLCLNVCACVHACRGKPKLLYDLLKLRLGQTRMQRRINE